MGTSCHLIIKVIGNFNNDGFNLFLEDVGDHDYVFISFDYIFMDLGMVILMDFLKMISQTNGLWNLNQICNYKNPSTDTLQPRFQIVLVGKTIV